MPETMQDIINREHSILAKFTWNMLIRGTNIAAFDQQSEEKQQEFIKQYLNSMKELEAYIHD